MRGLRMWFEKLTFCNGLKSLTCQTYCDYALNTMSKSYTCSITYVTAQIYTYIIQFTR